MALRWIVDITFPEERAPLGVETQRHWSDVAIARTTPADARDSFRSSPFVLSSSWGSKPFPFVRRPGTPTPCRLFPRRWLICVRSAFLALHLFFGVVLRRRHRSHSTGALRSPGGDARLCGLSIVTTGEHVEKVYLKIWGRVRACLFINCCKDVSCEGRGSVPST
jgi:hypothetical protein